MADDNRRSQTLSYIS
jgi:hypothetical protein